MLVVVESLFNEGLDFLDLFLSLQDVLSFGNSDSDFSTEMTDFDFNSLVSELSENLGEELMELSLEDSVGNELSLDGDLSGFVLLHF